MHRVVIHIIRMHANSTISLSATEHLVQDISPISTVTPYPAAILKTADPALSCIRSHSLVSPPNAAAVTLKLPLCPPYVPPLNKMLTCKFTFYPNCLPSHTFPTSHTSPKFTSLPPLPPSHLSQIIFLLLPLTLLPNYIPPSP